MNLLIGLINDPDEPLDESKVRPLDPGVVPVFRVLTWIRLGLTLLPFLVGLAFVSAGIITPGAIGPNREFEPELMFPFRILDILAPVLLLVYLYWKGLPERLGRLYLPPALLFATLEPILSQNILAGLSEGPILQFDSVIGAWTMLPILFAPLVLISWQYTLRTVVLYVLGTTILDMTLLTWFTGMFGEPLFPIYGAIGMRMASMLIAGYLIVQLMKTQRAQEADLSRANARLRGYLVTQEQLTTSRERNRLARELHDTLAHTLSMLAVQLEAASVVSESDPGQAQKLLDQSLDATRSGLTETRRALQALRASPLEDLGLALALEDLAHSATERSGVMIAVEIDDPLPVLSPLEEMTVYRTAQEAVTNTIRHAGAQKAVIRLREAEGLLTLQIEDDGRGFSHGETAGANGFGLQGLYERAEVTGGQLTVDSEPGRGTRIRLALEVG